MNSIEFNDMIVFWKDETYSRYTIDTQILWTSQPVFKNFFQFIRNGPKMKENRVAQNKEILHKTWKFQ
ncbi:hypothetical protein T01_6747 [Trichinella spiralis]|uniref:Uncharacterized protein n=1 Tax=Trichinella spiralis TaxID=6334 RepID=A0A0V0ZGZ1_TRISP|nr:hypothetical protein T01_6747 [Trichinella spiralis]